MSDKSKGSRSPAADAEDSVQAVINDLHHAQADGHLLHGMVKPAEASDGIMYAHIGGCDHWAYIPATAIQSIRRTGRVGCRGHSHATAEIELKVPDTALEKALANVAGVHHANLLQLQMVAPSPTMASPPCPPGQHWGRDQYGNLGCQGGY